MANIWGNSGNIGRLYFGGGPKSLQMVIAAMKLKGTAPWKKSCGQSRQHIKKHIKTKVGLVKAKIFPVVM